MNLIEQGIKKGLIKLDEDRKYITYTTQNKKRNFTNPEEKIQAETFLKLIFSYNYPPERVKQFVPVTMGSTTKEVDIVVYNDADCSQPRLVVECKKQEVSDLEFKQAVEQAASYSYALPGMMKYLWVTSGIRDEYFVIDRDSDAKRTLPDIPPFGAAGVEKYKYVKGGRKEDEPFGDDPVKKKFFELETIAEDELTRRFKLAHNALWAGGELNPSEAFDELDKLIFCKIWDERKARKKGEPYDFQVFNEPVSKHASKEEVARVEAKISQELFNRIKELYAEGKKKDPEVFKDDIRLNHVKVKTVVSYLESINLSATDLDSKGKAFETFMGSYFRGDFGQFFTPRPIVKFIVNCLPITHESRVLDTSCGSGGFLLYVLDKVRREAGVFYPDEIGDPERGIPEGRNHWRHWHDFAEQNLFGIELNEQIARTAKMNMIIHDDGHTNVIAADGLLKAEVMVKKNGNQGFKYNSFDFIATNPPFGSTVKQTEKAYLNQYNLGNKDVSWLDLKNTAVQGRANQSTEVLFIEQCWHFLTEGGFLAIVIPDGVLTNSSLQYVRDKIEEWFRIVAVVSMPQTAFAHTGAGVKSSVLFLRKWRAHTTEKYQNLKRALQEEVKSDNFYRERIEQFEKAKKQTIKTHDGFDNTTDETDKKAIEKAQLFKDWKKEITDQYNQKINDLKEDLTDRYLALKQQKLEDYPIFMAIAEDIGYDATGKPTGKNELELIEKELQNFIAHILNTEVL
ncbi:restriction endonuclease subunit M [Xanthovirga aplysinae]|uniref:restriction endonuclease subunit M n=1 Tax=Xanthovirga aplysinae TaxID=2529853 RepID=UPI0012BB7545|nr:N-6 DNA methylase [Xanthovirga aplysinae]MTI31097.1 restriction endonuclease subunit M [Xanthovirga aplysinae]